LSSIERTAANSHIEFVTDLQEISFPTEWYEANSEAHFWFQWRARATDALIRRLDLPVGSPLQVFDIGCGTGITCRLLGHTTSWVFDGADLNIEALTRCHAGVRRVLYYDILEKRQEFHERYDVIILFDVIEHIEHTTPFLDAVLFHLKPGGVILVNVPALMTLYGRYDTAAGHYRRYTKRTLADEFKPFDVSVVDQVYWGFTMVPLLFLRKLMQRAELSEDKTIRSGFYPPSPSAHTLLKTVMKLETGLVGRPPLGSSVLTAVRKNHADMTAKTPAPNIVETVAASGVPAPYVPPGHYYSPIPSAADIETLVRRTSALDDVPGVDLQETEQLSLLDALAAFYPEMPFTDKGSPDFRYRFDNPSYSYADGIFLYSMLRHMKPKRLIEVGSGYTSALTLDTNEHFLDKQLECTLIEPYPDLLLSLLRGNDREQVRIVSSRLQDVDLAIFDTLGAGDVLFIDSTHVAKVGSDVNYLFFEILPRLAVGVFVHIHDVFASFEYPIDWLREGRAWNEQYVLRAFLQFNACFRVRLFGNYMVLRHHDWFQRSMPLCLKNPGGAFWMQRVQ
jgi:SAM-dependent methyltransferase